SQLTGVQTCALPLLHPGRGLGVRLPLGRVLPSHRLPLGDLSGRIGCTLTSALGTALAFIRPAVAAVGAAVVRPAADDGKQGAVGEQPVAPDTDGNHVV